ncbi:hypothetical protein [Bacillus sp. JJ1474]|uniref:hypothetical protein n=1 Tax=Bacillus sp. JJ1474 TaxID=3122955 RepID=UPI002FFF9720
MRRIEKKELLVGLLELGQRKDTETYGYIKEAINYADKSVRYLNLYIDEDFRESKLDYIITKTVSVFQESDKDIFNEIMLEGLVREVNKTLRELMEKY